MHYGLHVPVLKDTCKSLGRKRKFQKIDFLGGCSGSYSKSYLKPVQICTPQHKPCPALLSQSMTGHRSQRLISLEMSFWAERRVFSSRKNQVLSLLISKASLRFYLNAINKELIITENQKSLQQIPSFKNNLNK